jgi:toxin ParE1/3/4
MTRRYRIAPSASQDLERISKYYMSRSIEAGERLFQEFNRKCQNLVQFPKMGRSYRHIAPLLRGLPLDGYIIFYEVTEEEVTILHVVSGSQDLEALFRQDPDL